MRSVRGGPLRVGPYWIGIECGQKLWLPRSWRRRRRGTVYSLYEMHDGECGWVRRFGPIMWWPELGR